VPNQPKPQTDAPVFATTDGACRAAGNEKTKEEHMTIGTVKFFNTAKGFGFIAPEGGGKDVFVHISALEAAGLRALSEGQKVSFDIQPDARGAKATNIKAV
jgi:CspA family cold shock protein